MLYRKIVLLALFVYATYGTLAQKPFMEGVIVYKVQLEQEGGQPVSGIYTFMIKGDDVRKELKLDNGYQNIMIMHCGSNKTYSLQSRNGKKYAIEMNMKAMAKAQQRFQGFGMSNETPERRKIAGYAVYKCNVHYHHDSTALAIQYTKEWEPLQEATFERFPNAHFLPLNFSYKEEHGMTMSFEAEQIQPGPVDNAEFDVPGDYKLLSYAEYKELSN